MSKPVRFFGQGIRMNNHRWALEKGPAPLQISDEALGPGREIFKDLVKYLVSGWLVAG